MRSVLQSTLLGSGVAAIAYWRRALTLDGAVAAAAMGAIVFLNGGVPAAGALLAFFVSSSVLSLLGQEHKTQAKGARRDAWQVLANGGWATCCIALAQREAYIGALATAGADTWGTEVGMLAGRPPRLITTLERVPAGTSGGITPEGLAAGLGGAVLVGLTWSVLGGGQHGVRTTALAGLCGSLLDSWLGATVQAFYVCPSCDVATEEPVHPACGKPATLQRGIPWMTNDGVNALATLAGALIAALLARVPDAAGHVRGGS